MTKKTRLLVIVIVALFLIGVFAIWRHHETKAPWYAKEMEFDALRENYNASGITIGIIDTGCSDGILKQRKSVAKYNAIDHSRDVSDGSGHGTSMTSIIAGTNDGEIISLAQDANLVIIKAADDNGRMTHKSLLEALKYAEKANCDIVNISLGGYIASKDISVQLRKMYNRNITIVASSGDYGQKDLLFPANQSPYVVSVAAMDESGKLWEDSNNAKNLITAFPGTDIESINSDGQVETSSGTSEATALATSYISLLKKEYRKKHSREISNKKLNELLCELYLDESHNKYVNLLQDI